MTRKQDDPTRAGLCHAVRVGDIVYLPRSPTSKQLGRAYPRLRKAPSPQLPLDVQRILEEVSIGSFAAHAIARAAQIEAATDGTPPAWVATLPPTFRRYIAGGCAIHEAAEDPQILSAPPYTGLQGRILVDLDTQGLLGQAFRHFQLQRLSHIRQLGWLGVPFFDTEEVSYLRPMNATNNRLVHVWTVAAIANQLAARLNLSPSQQATLVLAAATHDARTPAGGDTAKFLDPRALDEDANYPELLTAFDSESFLHQFQIPRNGLIETIQGKGLLGTLLDIADKTAYVARDAQVFKQSFADSLRSSTEHRALLDLLNAHPEDACTAWQYVAVRKGRVVFTDAEALARFLHLRLLLFRGFYHHPAARYTECVASYAILKQLMARGKIRLNDLLTWTDAQLDQFIYEYSTSSIEAGFGRPVYEGFDTEAEAVAREAALHATGEWCTLLERWYTHIKTTGTSWLVQHNGRGRVRPLRESHPALAAPIDALQAVLKPFRLYWICRDTMSPRLAGLFP